MMGEFRMAGETRALGLRGRPLRLMTGEAVAGVGAVVAVGIHPRARLRGHTHPRRVAPDQTDDQDEGNNRGN